MVRIQQAELNSLLKKHKLDAIILRNSAEPLNPVFADLSETDVYGIIIIQKAKSILYTVNMEVERAKRSSTLPVKVYVNELDAYKKKRIGVELASAPLLWAKKLDADFVDVGEELALLTSPKSKKELKTIERAVKITEEIFVKTFLNFSSFHTEQEVANFMHKLALDTGCELAYPVIVASGKNSSLPHHVPSNKPLQQGFCVIDFGVKYQGFCADITRTIFIGEPKEKDVKHYYAVLDALESAERAAHNKTCAAPDQAARKSLGVLAPLFIHSTGHGLGRVVHEGFSLHEKSSSPIPLGAVFTLEPGIYKRNVFGIRIEDDYVMTARGPRKLSTLGRHLLIIKRRR